MRIQVRDAVFETNSSSSHSVTVSRDELRQQTFSKETLRAGEINVQLGQYGWEWARYYTPEKKLAYLLTQAWNSKSTVKAICEIVEEHTGCSVVIAMEGRDGTYVDHDSSGVGLEMTRDRETLLDFLFTPGCYVETGNDNSTAGEYIETDLGPQLYHARQIVQEVPEGERFKLAIPYGMDTVMFEKDGEAIGGSLDDLRTMYAISEAFDGVVVVSAEVNSTSSHEVFESDQAARDAVHQYLHMINPQASRYEEGSVAEPPVITVAADATIFTTDKSREGKRRFGDASFYDAMFQFECVAPPATVEAIRTAVATALEASNAPRPKR